jgi:hypothetical protein
MAKKHWSLGYDRLQCAAAKPLCLYEIKVFWNIEPRSTGSDFVRTIHDREPPEECELGLFMESATSPELVGLIWKRLLG